jgi:hypothetical protein
VFNVLLHEELLDKNSYLKMRIGGKEITNMLFGLIESLE